LPLKERGVVERKDAARFGSVHRVSGRAEKKLIAES